jgi:hypothetical protein
MENEFQTMQNDAEALAMVEDLELAAEAKRRKAREDAKLRKRAQRERDRQKDDALASEFDRTGPAVWTRNLGSLSAEERNQLASIEQERDEITNAIRTAVTLIKNGLAPTTPVETTFGRLLAFEEDYAAPYGRKIIPGFSHLDDLVAGPVDKSEVWHYFGLEVNIDPFLRKEFLFAAAGYILATNTRSDGAKKLISTVLEVIEPDLNRKPHYTGEREFRIWRLYVSAHNEHLGRKIIDYLGLRTQPQNAAGV